MKWHIKTKFLFFQSPWIPSWHFTQKLLEQRKYDTTFYFWKLTLLFIYIIQVSFKNKSKSAFYEKIKTLLFNSYSKILLNIGSYEWICTFSAFSKVQKSNWKFLKITETKKMRHKTFKWSNFFVIFEKITKGWW